MDTFSHAAQKISGKIKATDNKAHGEMKKSTPDAGKNDLTAAQDSQEKMATQRIGQKSGGGEEKPIRCDHGKFLVVDDGDEDTLGGDGEQAGEAGENTRGKVKRVREQGEACGCGDDREAGESEGGEDTEGEDDGEGVVVQGFERKDEDGSARKKGEKPFSLDGTESF